MNPALASHPAFKGEGRKLRRARNFVKRYELAIVELSGPVREVQRLRYERATALIVADILTR